MTVPVLGLLIHPEMERPAMREQINALYVPRTAMSDSTLHRGASVFHIPTGGLALDEEHHLHLQ